MPIRPRTALLGAGACAALVALDWFAAFHVGLFEHADQSIYLQFGGLQSHARIDSLAARFVSLFEPNPYVYLVLAVLVVALLRGRPRIVLAVGAIILGANLTTEVLKHLVATPRAGSLFNAGVSWIPAHSWPSGHSTAVMSLVLASVLAVPARLRPAVAGLGASLAVAVGYSLLARLVHYPSDVLGGFLVAAIWALGGVAALLALERRRPAARSSTEPISVRAALGAPGAVLAGALLVGAILVVSGPHDVIGYVRAHQAFVAGAAAVAALSLALSTGVLLSVRR
jgi:membrane-associated phospholipid phosphatase